METREQPATERSKTKTTRYLVAAALLGGGVTLGAVFSPIGLAGAQSSDTDTDSTDTDSTDTETDRPVDGDRARDGRPGRGRGGPDFPVGRVLGLLDLTPEELEAAFAEGKTVAEIAEEQGVGTDELVAELVAGVEERLDQAVADERIDADEAEARLAEIESRIEAFVTTEPGDDGFPAGRRDHPGRHGLPGVEGEEVADLLGLTTDELRAGLTDGKSLADIATEQGVTTDELTAFLVAQATEAIDQAVADGDVDPERAEQAKEQLAERIAIMVERTPGDRSDRGLHDHPHSHPHRHPHGGHPNALDPNA